MGKRKRYSTELQQELVRLVRAGRTPEQLAAEFEPSAQAIRNWVKQAELDEGTRTDGLKTEEREELARLRRENARLKEEREILFKSRGLVRAGDREEVKTIFFFIDAHQAMFSIRAMCRVLEVSASGYYAWRRRMISVRTGENEKLQQRIRTIHDHSRQTYGAPRIHAELKDEGTRVGRKRVARLMKESGLAGVSRRKSTVTTRRNRSARPAPDLVDRQFAADKPNQLWVADITYVPTWVGFLYLAVVLDVWSRKIVGWAMASHLRTPLVTAALDMAITQRSPTNVIHHSDQGCQYTSIEFGKRCRQAGIRPSMGSVGDCYDNAMCESFFATLECELIDRSAFKNHDEARHAIFDFIEGFYNTHRRHSALSYDSPVQFENRQAAHAA
ncbi:MAG TPA: IS3 family transposase [Thermoanaerobaculia bacterium]|nr:IS3 family transposase [Thermoanaerobaculia bacterium]